MKQLGIKSFLIFLLILFAIVPLQSHFKSDESQLKNINVVTETSPKSGDKGIKIIVSSQDSEGLTVNNFDLSFLRYFENTTLDGVKRKAKEHYSSLGVTAPIIEFSSEANYVESGPMKLAVVRLSSSDGARQVFIAGLVGKEFKRVLCVRNTTESIPITYGECAEKIKEVFGVIIGS